MSDRPTLTPETDSAEFPVMTWPKDDHPMVVRADLARTLERERDEWRKKAVELCAQRDKLAEALKELRNAEWLSLPGRAGDIIESALAAVEGGKLEDLPDSSNHP